MKFDFYLRQGFNQEFEGIIVVVTDVHPLQDVHDDLEELSKDLVVAVLVEVLKDLVRILFGICSGFLLY
jgi:hypothetical protein